MNPTLLDLDRVHLRASQGPLWYVGIRIERVALALMMATLMSACSPEFDWREVRVDDASFVVLLPAKPASMTRRIELDGLSLDMTMHGAKVRDTAYTVGVINLPDSSEATQSKAIAAMQAAMVRNISGTERANRPVSVTRVDASGARVDAVPGNEIEAIGRMGEREARLLARFVAVDGRAWQVVALGPDTDREQAEQFIESVRLIRP
jgi:hypothetical protein